jgi:hypothetical protein
MAFLLENRNTIKAVIFAMKFSVILCLSLFLFSCSEKNGKPNNSPKAQRNDTNIIRPTAINPHSPVDMSPMDITYLPVDFPVLKMTKGSPQEPIARVIYSRPHRQGRKIFGGLLKYGEPWRLGANEATEIEIFQPLRIQGKTVARGRYIMYCIPTEDKWTIVFNNNTYTWGLQQDPKKDAYRFDIPIQKTTTSIENFTMVFKGEAPQADLIIAWDEVEAHLPFSTL